MSLRVLTVWLALINGGNTMKTCSGGSNGWKSMLNKSLFITKLLSGIGCESEEWTASGLSVSDA